MNLNQPITIDSIRALPIFKHAATLVVTITSLLAIIFFGIQSYSLYLNSQDYNQKNLEFIEINNQINSTQKRIAKLLHIESRYFSDLGTAPQTKSELVDLLSNIGASSKLVIKKLVANEGAQGQQKEDYIDLELDGSYTGINEFISRISPLLSASNIESLRLEKRKEAQFIHAIFSIKFTKPPLLNIKPSPLKAEIKGHDEHDHVSQHLTTLNTSPVVDNSLFVANDMSGTSPVVAFRLNGEEYYYGTAAGDWKFYNVGFVQQPDIKNPEQDVSKEIRKDPLSISNEDAPTKRQDPFLPSPKTVQNGFSVSGDNVSGTFLSGIIYAESQGLCIVTLPSGESKVFAEGEYINAKTRIKSIRADHVYVQSKMDRLYKVGQEIYAK